MRSAVLVSRSKRAPAMLVSSSDGLAREGLLGAILLIDMVAGLSLVSSRVGWLVGGIVGERKKKKDEVKIWMEKC